MEPFQSEKFRSLVTDLLKQHHIPGLSIAVVHNNKIVSTGYGTANLESNTPCTGDTLFDIASCSKSLTAASVALLVDDKKHPKLQYDALMSELLPDDFVMSDKSYTEGITVEDVLSHKTGMASHDSASMGPKAKHPDSAKSVTTNLRNLKPAAPLRSRYLYCNQMYTVATHLVEETCNKSFPEFLEERIFVPLGMNSTALQPATAQANGWGDRMAKGYIWESWRQTWRGFDPENCPEAQGAGSVISSANDLIKWVKALLCHEGPINDVVYQGLTKMRSIPNSNAKKLKPHTTPAIYTAGMEMHFYRGNMVIGHDGQIPGFSARFFFMPDSNFGAVVLGNSAGAGGAATTITRALMDEVLGVSVEDRQGKEKAKKEKSKGTQQPGGHMQKKQGEKPKKRASEKSPRSLQETPLEAYVGRYWNAGYRNMTVQIKHDQLFIDATDRSMGFTMTFEHVKNQTEYIGHLKDDIELGDEPVDAEFVFEHGKAVRMGLDLEPAIKEMIWFTRQEDD